MSQSVEEKVKDKYEEPEVSISQDEFLRMFKPKSSCKVCYGRGFYRVVTSRAGKTKDGRSLPIRKKIKPTEGKPVNQDVINTMGTLTGINLCQCSMKQYHRFVAQDGGENYDIVMNPEISKKQVPMSKAKYDCSALSREVNARECFTCWMDSEPKAHATRALCVRRNAVKLENDANVPTSTLKGDSIS